MPAPIPLSQHRRKLSIRVDPRVETIIKRVALQ